MKSQATQHLVFYRVTVFFFLKYFNKKMKLCDPNLCLKLCRQFKNDLFFCQIFLIGTVFDTIFILY